MVAANFIKTPQRTVEDAGPYTHAADTIKIPSAKRTP